MKNKKTTVNLSPENAKKIRKLSKETGRSQSDLINAAITNVPIISMGNQKDIAECFFDLRKATVENSDSDIGKAVNQTCQSLNFVTAKIEVLMQSRKV